MKLQARVKLAVIILVALMLWGPAAGQATVSSSTNTWSYAGDDVQTIFPYLNRIYAASDLKVYLRNALGVATLQVYGSAYTVDGVLNNAGGNIIFSTAPATGQTVVIQIELPLTQALTLPEAGRIPSAPLEIALDRATKVDQQLKEELGRSFRMAPGNTAVTELPAPAANNIIGWDSLGANLTHYPVVPVAAVIADISQYDDSLVQAVTTIGGGAKLLLVNKALTLDSNLTIPDNIQLWITREGRIDIATTKTLTINGPLDAGPYQIFSLTGTGAVAGLKEARPEWFGVTGTNDQIAIQAAQNSLVSTGGVVLFNPGTTYNVVPALLESDYNHSPADDFSYVAVEVTKSNVTFKGSGGATLKISGGTAPGTPGDHLNYIFGNKLATAPVNVVYEGLIFDLNRGAGGANNQRGVLAVSTTGLHFKGCKFTSTILGNYGIALYNCSDVSVDQNCLFYNVSGGIAAIYSNNIRIDATFDTLHECVDLDKMNSNVSIGGIIKNVTAGSGNAGIDSNATIGLVVTTVFKDVAATNIIFNGKVNVSDTWAHWLAGTDKLYRPGIGLRVNSTWNNCAYDGTWALIVIGDNWADTPTRTTQYGCSDIVISGAGYKTGQIYIKEGTQISLANLSLHDVVAPTSTGAIYAKSTTEWDTYPDAEIYGDTDVTLSNVHLNGVDIGGVFADYVGKFKMHGCSITNCNTLNGTSNDVNVTHIEKRNTLVDISHNDLYAGKYSYRGIALNGTGGTGCKVIMKSNRVHGTYLGTYKIKIDGDLIDYLEAETAQAYFGTVAAGANAEKPVFIAPSDCYVANIWLVNGATVAKNDTNYDTWSVKDKGSDGSGTTVIQAITTKVTGGYALTAFDAVSVLFALPEAAAYLAKNDILSLDKAFSGGGGGSTDLVVRVLYVEY